MDKWPPHKKHNATPLYHYKHLTLKNQQWRCCRSQSHTSEAPRIHPPPVSLNVAQTIPCRKYSLFQYRNCTQHTTRRKIPHLIVKCGSNHRMALSTEILSAHLDGTKTTALFIYQHLCWRQWQLKKPPDALPLTNNSTPLFNDSHCFLRS